MASQDDVITGINSSDMKLSYKLTYLVFVMVGPDVVKARGREERRGMSEELAAAAYWEEHLCNTFTNTNIRLVL